MSASFHVQDEGIEHQDEMPPVPDPETLAIAQDSEDPETAWLAREWSDWDLRMVPKADIDKRPGAAAQQQVWFRSREALPDDPVFHVCTLAYMSDMTLLGSSRGPHMDVAMQSASLDHAMWFLRPFRADEWLLYDQTSPSAGLGRALTQGRIFDSRGNMVAAVVQEGLTSCIARSEVADVRSADVTSIAVRPSLARPHRRPGRMVVSDLEIDLLGHF